MFSLKRLRRLSANQCAVVVCCLLLATSLPTAECSFRICGFRLTTMLTAICKNQFCGGYVLGSPKVDPESGEVSELVDPMFVFPAVRKRSGIATECCEKRCSLSYLKTFCCAGYEAATAAND